MKQKILKPAKSIIFLFLSTLFSLISFVQNKKVDIDINTKSGNDNFFLQPWVWVVGAALFILLLVALLRGKK